MIPIQDPFAGRNGANYDYTNITKIKKQEHFSIAIICLKERQVSLIPIMLSIIHRVKSRVVIGKEW